MNSSETRLRVLLVEDSQLLSDRLQELLSEISGIDTIGVVVTENDAIQAIQTQHPDVVLLDLRLKQGTGFGVIRHINTLPTRPDVVVMTNYALPQYRRQAEILGARFFLDKTEEFDQLPEVLRTLQEQASA